MILAEQKRKYAWSMIFWDRSVCVSRWRGDPPAFAKASAGK
jgi:hypothetical protein